MFNLPSSEKQGTSTTRAKANIIENGKTTDKRANGMCNK